MKTWNIIISAVIVALLAVILGVLVNLKSEVTAAKTVGFINYGAIAKLMPKGETQPEILTKHKLRVFNFGNNLYSSKTELSEAEIKSLEAKGYDVVPTKIEPAPFGIDKTGKTHELITYHIRLIDTQKVLE